MAPISTTILSSTAETLLLPSLSRALDDVATSQYTIRICAAAAALPILLHMLAHVLMQFGRRLHRMNASPCEKNYWLLVHFGLLLLCVGKYLAVPIGVVLLILGLLFADLDISVTGVATIALVYAADVGSWGAAGRVWFLIRLAPDMIGMQRWRVDGIGQARTFGTGADEDHYERGWKDFKRILARAEQGDVERLLRWREELILDLLASKFVDLTEKEIQWKGGTHGPLGDPSVEELTHMLRRFEKGWEGSPGVHARSFTSFVEDPSKPTRKATLRFVVVLFELICRNKIQDITTQRRLLERVLRESRDPQNGTMAWVLPFVYRCM